MADTDNYGGALPTVDADEDAWGEKNNTLHQLWDTTIFAVATTVPLAGATDTYTLALTDAGTMLKLNKATAFTVTVPPNSSVAFTTGARIELLQYGAGQITIAAGDGVTIRSSGSKLKIRGQYSAACLEKLDTDEWVLIGDISA